jgi:hypothetical protein
LGERPLQEIAELERAEHELDEARAALEDRAGDLVDEAIEDVNSTEHELVAMLERSEPQRLEAAREELPSEELPGEELPSEQLPSEEPARDEGDTIEPDEGDKSAP